VSLEKVGSGPNAPGDKLRYVYKQGGKTSETACEIVARTPGERLHCKCFDRMLDEGRQQGVMPPAARKSQSIAVMVGLEGAFLGDVDVGGLFWRQFG
jgi:hypothetical protein